MQPKKSKMENRDDTKKLLPLMFLTAVLQAVNAAAIQRNRIEQCFAAHIAHSKTLFNPVLQQAHSFMYPYFSGHFRGLTIVSSEKKVSATITLQEFHINLGIVVIKVNKTCQQKR